MSLHRFTGPYPAQYDTPTGSRMVEPGEDIDWEQQEPQPACWWTEVDPPADDDTSGSAEPSPETPPADPPDAPVPAPRSTSAKASPKSSNKE
ncbi:hypothetical protein [Actinocrispum wychmicini]|uniref:Uncharacterized protein n=1 Tax=Actinocrispum wychmicini TaxID=1213861 RepID=A0A4R2JFU9_9PSEU|nr:hypothetical protein [Actinocrispum wychmicini]TCO57122.1 hypothetical protein EV192_106599 [Actinocrispum wychmicini]